MYVAHVQSGFLMFTPLHMPSGSYTPELSSVSSVYMYVCMYTYIHTYLHTYIHSREVLCTDIVLCPHLSTRGAEPSASIHRGCVRLWRPPLWRPPRRGATKLRV